MKKGVLTFVLFLQLVYIVGQEKKINYKFYGFVANSFFYNSRQNKESVDGLFCVYPLDVKADANGVDLNKVSQSEMLSIDTRLGIDVSGLDVLGAVTNAKVEVDFNGNSSILGALRMRHAYFDMNWGKVDLLMGQTWHPLFGEVKPTMLNSNSGNPFQPFARCPQVNLAYKVKGIKLFAVGSYQLQYMSDGSIGKSNTYLKNANMPDMFVGVENKSAAWIIGAGAEMKTLDPRTSSTVSGKTYKVNESLTSYVATAYAQYTKSLFCVKAKSVYGQNLSDLGMIGGYAVSAVDAESGKQDYVAFNTLSSWLNLTYGKKWQVGLMGGYYQNFGTNSALYSASGNLTMYGVGFDGNKMVGSMYSITPQVSYNIANWRVGAEYEYTSAQWGTVSANDGIVRNANEVVNNRVVGIVSYMF